MKGVGRVTGWRVEHRGANDIEWEQAYGKRTTAVWKVGLGGGKIGYELTTGGGKVRTFRGTGGCNRALAAAKRYMVAHPRR